MQKVGCKADFFALTRVLGGERGSERLEATLSTWRAHREALRSAKSALPMDTRLPFKTTMFATCRRGWLVPWSLSRRARMNVVDECAMGLAASIPPSVARTLGLIEKRASNRA